MWTDPLDDLIADLEQIAPPEPGQYGGGQEALTELQHWTARVLRRLDDTYPDGPDFTDPDVQRECEHMGRAMNRYLGRPEDWTPPKGPCSCRQCAPHTGADPVDTDDRHIGINLRPLSERASCGLSLSSPW